MNKELLNNPKHTINQLVKATKTKKDYIIIIEGYKNKIENNNTIIDIYFTAYSAIYYIKGIYKTKKKTFIDMRDYNYYKDIVIKHFKEVENGNSRDYILQNIAL